MKFPEYPFAFMHRGKDGCGGPIALLRCKPMAGDVVTSRDAIHLDGAPIELGSPMRCDTCGELVSYALFPPLSFVEPRE
jgi:hypothetical protein